MKFLITMRDRATYVVEASYIEVARGPGRSYTFLGPVAGYPIAIVAAFPTELVAAVLPLSQADPKTAGRPERKVQAPARPPLPAIGAADV